MTIFENLSLSCDACEGLPGATFKPSTKINQFLFTEHSKFRYLSFCPVKIVLITLHHPEINANVSSKSTFQ